MKSNFPILSKYACRELTDKSIESQLKELNIGKFNKEEIDESIVSSLDERGSKKTSFESNFDYANIRTSYFAVAYYKI